MIAVHFLIFGEMEEFSEIRPVVSMLAGGPGLLVLVFLWNLFWAPFKLEVESREKHNNEIDGNEKTIAGLEEEILALRGTISTKSAKQATVDGLAKFLEGAVQLIMRRVKNSQERETWFYDFES